MGVVSGAERRQIDFTLDGTSGVFQLRKPLTFYVPFAGKGDFLARYFLTGSPQAENLVHGVFRMEYRVPVL